MGENYRKSGLVGGFIDSIQKFPQRPALDVNEELYTYEELGKIVSQIAQTINDNDSSGNQLAAMLGYRSLAAYAGVLGILTSGRGYVPLNPEFPVERNHTMLELSGTSILIVGSECLKTLEGMLPKCKDPLTIILPDTEDVSALASQFSNHKFISSKELSKADDVPAAPTVDPESTAYLLFTSGSTGVPKGVPVNHKNVLSYIQYVCDRYDVNENDLLSQTFDMTFDLSVHDMFVCWERGACLCCVPKNTVMAPAKFIMNKKITIWFSVPSVGIFMSRLHMLKPGLYPSIRYSLFCGEALPATVAEKWQEAAPNSIVENLYGPTEATIAITQYRWDKDKSPAKCRNGLVPIGEIFTGQNFCIIGEDGKLVNDGEAGELCLLGSQVTNGYLNNPEKTKQQFVPIAELNNEIAYKTGDLVEEDEEGVLHYLTRIDNQVKILGHRVELQEIDEALRKSSGIDSAVSVAWPVKEGSAGGIIGFLAASNGVDKHKIIEFCKEQLPEYMVPREIHVLENLPLNPNGKVDRKKLAAMLDSGELNGRD